VALVFVPAIGFRPRGTRTLTQRAETIADETRLAVIAAAAAPDRTDVIVEWTRTGDPAVCSPGSRILVHSNRAPLENGLVAELRVGTSRLEAIALTRRSFHLSHNSLAAVDEIRFPRSGQVVEDAELLLREGAILWRVPFSVASSGADATPLRAEVRQDGILVRATALSRYESELIVELEVESERQIRQVGGPVPSPPAIPGGSEEDRLWRRAEMHRHFGENARPIILEDDLGGHREELRRLFAQEPQQAASGDRYSNRFSVVFDAPGSDVRHATLVIPFVELNVIEPSATVNLRDLPLDVELAEHRFRVLAVTPHGADQRRIVIELLSPAVAPRFMQPARVQGSDLEFGWQRHDADAPGNAIWMATRIGDPPIVTFSGVVLRVDGPLRLELPLAPPP
jgi:hypothetical protein